MTLLALHFILLLSGLIGLGIYIGRLRAELAVRSWPAVEGVIVNSQLEETYDQSRENSLGLLTSP